MATYVNTVRYGLSVNTTVLADCSCDSVFLFEDTGDTFTDETTDANSTTTADVPLASFKTAGDCIYIGDAATFSGLLISMSTATVGGARVLEYYNGAAWVECETQTVAVGTLLLTGTSNVIYWYPSADWATVAVNSVTQYWVRLRVSTTNTTGGTISYVAIGRHHPEWTKTIYIPETTSRTFKAAFVRGITNIVGSNVPYGCLFVKVGTGTRVGAFLNPALSWSQQLPLSVCIDATASFTAGFGAGASQTITVMLVTVCPQAATRYSQGANASGEVIITYEAEEQQTRIKTVCIPIETKITDTTTSLVEIGTNQWPNLSTFCPEASPVFREAVLQIRGEWTSVAAAYLSVSLDAEAAIDLGTLASSAYTLVPFEFFWVRNDAATNAVHAIKIKHTGTSATGKNIGALLWVTYEYDHTNSSTILNSFRVAMPGPQPVWYDTSHKSQCREEFLVNEPATVTLVQSAIVMKAASNVQRSFVAAVGSQVGRVYLTAGNYAPVMMVQRFDSGGDKGAGHTLVRGSNVITATVWQVDSNTSTVADILCYAVVNYTSAKASGGAQTHNKTVWVALTTVPEITLPAVDYASVVVPLGTSYHVGSLLWHNFWVTYGNTALEVLRAAGEGDAISSSVAPLYGPVAQAAHKDGMWGTSATGLVKRFPTDPRWGLVDASVSHTWEVIAGTKTFSALEVTFHSITETVTGTVSGYTGDGSGLTVHLFREDTDEYLGTATTAAGGGYTFTWYSDNMNLYATCRQSDVLCGRSTDGKAS